MEVNSRTNDEWEMDKKSYTLIRVNKPVIEVSIMKVQEEHLKGKFVANQETLADYEGKKPEDLYYRIIKDGWITNLQHAAYLGSELRRAYLAMKLNKKYVQDSELEL